MEKNNLRDTHCLIMTKEELKQHNGDLLKDHTVAQYNKETIHEHELSHLIRELEDNEVCLIMTYFYDKNKTYTSGMLIEAILSHYNSTSKEIFIHDRHEHKRGIRQIIQAFLWYCSKERILKERMTLEQIGLKTGRFNYATILNSAKIVKDYYETDACYRERIKKLLKFLKIDIKELQNGGTQNKKV